LPKASHSSSLSNDFPLVHRGHLDARQPNRSSYPGRVQANRKGSAMKAARRRTPPKVPGRESNLVCATRTACGHPYSLQTVGRRLTHIVRSRPRI
jgi:hypothetical protein